MKKKSYERVCFDVHASPLKYSLCLDQPKITPFSFTENSAGKMVKVICFTNQRSTLTWNKDGEVIYDGQNGVSIKEYDGMLILSISSLRAEHSGNYTCNAKNQYGSSSFSAPLVVTAPPRWVDIPPVKMTLLRGGDQKLVCDAEGHPNPNVIWTLPNSMLIKAILHKLNSFTLYKFKFVRCRTSWISIHLILLWNGVNIVWYGHIIRSSELTLYSKEFALSLLCRDHLRRINIIYIS